MRVDEVVVISLPERVERRRRLAGQMQAPDWPFPLPPHWQDGVREAGPPWYRSSDGAWGCRQAHVNVLQRAWDNGTETTLVLEDDAVFAPNLGPAWADLRYRVPANWSMFMLGGEHITAPQPLGKTLVRCVNTRRTHAYLIRLRAIPFLLRTFTTARRHIDHSLTDFQRGCAVYAPATFLIGQDAGPSDISGKSNEEVRFWQPPVEARTGLELELELNRRATRNGTAPHELEPALPALDRTVRPGQGRQDARRLPPVRPGDQRLRA